MTMEQMSVSLDLMHLRMNDILNTGNPELNEIISYLLSEPGKMLRPRLVFLASSLYPSDPKVVQDAAIALELIHMASLVHDDVIDGSLLRRGRDSVNGRWGSKASVLVGDYLFATAFNLLNQHHIPDILESVTSTIQTMCSGEIQQLSTVFNTDLSLSDYLDRIYRKTACLFECCCRVGALASTMPAQQRKNLQMYGVSMGLAYHSCTEYYFSISQTTVIEHSTFKYTAVFKYQIAFHKTNLLLLCDQAFLSYYFTGYYGGKGPTLVFLAFIRVILPFGIET
jgi:heptaprenyl diphosphate synthase